MTESNRSKITVTASVRVPVEKAWDYWTDPAHITQWNNASEDWHTPRAENDLRPGGRFVSRMEAKVGSFGFDFSGTYDEVIPLKSIIYTLDDDRRVQLTFTDQGHETHIIETFEAESENSVELQQEGWQAILDNFKRYAESR